MHGPGPVGWLLVALGCGTGGYCLLRLRGVRAWWRQGAAAEGAMGLGMAAMAGLTAPVGLGRPLGAFFVVVTAWCALLPGAAAHRAHHLVEGAAMVYMALAMAGGGEAGHAHEGGAGGVPWLTGVLAAYFALRALRAGRRLVPGKPGRGAPGVAAAGGRPPEVAAACRAALSMGMLAMLLTL
jgi:hypothetical protein